MVHSALWPLKCAVNLASIIINYIHLNMLPVSWTISERQFARGYGLRCPVPLAWWSTAHRSASNPFVSYLLCYLNELAKPILASHNRCKARHDYSVARPGNIIALQGHAPLLRCEARHHNSFLAPGTIIALQGQAPL